jgi:hypothetical protein
MSYETYLKKYNRLVAKMVRLGLIYCRKVFWRLQHFQVKQYAKIQLESMRNAVKALEG